MCGYADDIILAVYGKVEAEIKAKLDVSEIDFNFIFVLLFDCLIKSQVKWSAKEDDPPLPQE